MIASEYGWTDEHILDIPLRRLRQISASISQRIDGEQRLRESLLEWQTKTLATFISGTAASGKAVKTLMKHVKNIQIRPKDADVPHEVGMTTREGGLTWDPENPDIDESNLPDANAVMGMFGGSIERSVGDGGGE